MTKKQIAGIIVAVIMGEIILIALGIIEGMKWWELPVFFTMFFSVFVAVLAIFAWSFMAIFSNCDKKKIPEKKENDVLFNVEEQVKYK